MPAFDPLPILLVEDSEDDLFLFRRLFAKAGIRAVLSVAENGQQAIRHLEAALVANSSGQAVLPRLIFLDLKLPLRSGFEVLHWIRAQPTLAQVAVVVLSSSAEARDVTEAFKRGAQGYLVKYPAPPVFADIVHAVSEHRPGTDLNALKLPGVPRPAS